MSNFTFFESRWSDLAKLGSLAEKYVYSDPNSSILKQGMCAESMVQYMLAYDGIQEPGVLFRSLNLLTMSRLRSWQRS